jgi:cell division septation protein DedD
MSLKCPSRSLSAIEIQPEPSSFLEMLVVSLSPEVVACQAQLGAAVEPPPTPPSGGSDVDGAITPPKKTRDRKPNYPISAQLAGQQGVVQLTAMITDTGCVATARVTRTVSRSSIFPRWSPSSPGRTLRHGSMAGRCRSS